MRRMDFDSRNARNSPTISYEAWTARPMPMVPRRGVGRFFDDSM